MPNYEDYDAYKSGTTQQKQKDFAANNTSGMMPVDDDNAQRVVQGIIGGPVGWYEAATGKKILSQELLNMTGDMPAYAEMDDKDVFESMSQDDWAQFNKMNADGRRQFVDSRKKRIGPEVAARAEAEAKRVKQEADEAKYKAWRMATMERLDAFSKEMGMPVEELIARGDLGVRNAGAMATNQASTAAYGAGLGGGGVSAMNTQRAVTDAQAKYQMQRQGLGLQATSNLLGEMGQMGREGEDTRRYEQNMNLQLQGAQEQARQRQFAENQGRQSGLYGLAGGVIGGIYGGPTGAAFGSQLGQGLGGMTSGTYQPKAYTYPKGNTSSGSGGLGGGRYGGAQ